MKIPEEVARHIRAIDEDKARQDYLREQAVDRHLRDLTDQLRRQAELLELETEDKLHWRNCAIAITIYAVLATAVDAYLLLIK